jgi:hypothetical protein
MFRLFMFGPKREKITGGWGKLHTAGVHGPYFSPLRSNHIKEIEMDEECGTHELEEICTHDFDAETCRKETT